MHQEFKRSMILAYAALAYAVCVLCLTGLVPARGQWHSFRSYHRTQAEAFLTGKISLSQDPRDLDLDLCWSGGGVQQVWGLGIGLWQAPLDALARLCGRPGFPDRLALGLFMALAAYVVGRTWWHFMAPPSALTPLNYASAGGVTVFLLAFPPTMNLLRSPLDHYGETLAYVYFFGILLICGLVATVRRPRWGGFYVLCLMAGVGGLIRPTLVFYGFATYAIAVVVLLRASANKAALVAVSPTALWIRLLAGSSLFGLGGTLLFVTNWLRFGSGWEFGHSLNVSPALISVYSTRFDYPFKHVPFAESARELFGALFQVRRFNGFGWYENWILGGQSMVVRWRGFNLTTYDLSHAILLGAAWTAGAYLVWRWWVSRRHKALPTSSLDSVVLGLIGWSFLSALPLIAFYMKAPAIADRYMLDFAPSIAAALVGLWLFFMERCRLYPSREKWVLWLLCLAAAVWNGIEIDRGLSNWGPPLSSKLDVLAGPGRQNFARAAHLPNEYRNATAAMESCIPYNGQGWDTNGATSCCGIFFVESPRFLELQLKLGPGHLAGEAPPEKIQAKIGLERLSQQSVLRSNGTWTVLFAGPKRRLNQEGIQPAFVAFVPAEDLGNYVTATSPWVLERIAWRRR